MEKMVGVITKKVGIITEKVGVFTLNHSISSKTRNETFDRGEPLLS